MSNDDNHEKKSEIEVLLIISVLHCPRRIIAFVSCEDETI